MTVSENSLIDCFYYYLLFFKTHKKRPNTIPIFGPGKWLSRSRALKVGIYEGDVALPFNIRTARWNCQQTGGAGP
ncbi:hypothetical protein CBF16_10930 [Pantoea agglomerans]|nr:hypothetical protein CBF16_10930 [Pantoea agglomerans]